MVKKKSDSGTSRAKNESITLGDFVKSDAKPVRYEKPGARPAPSPKPPKKK